MQQVIAFIAGMYVTQAIHSYFNWRGMSFGRALRVLFATLWPLSIGLFMILNRIAD